MVSGSASSPSAAVWSLSTGTSSSQLSPLLEERECSRGWDKPGGLPLYLPTTNIEAADDFSWANSSQLMAATLWLPVGVAEAERAAG